MYFEDGRPPRQSGSLSATWRLALAALGNLIPRLQSEAAEPVIPTIP